MKIASFSQPTLSLMNKGLFAFFFFALSVINSSTEEKVAAITFNYVKTSCNQFDFTINNPSTYSLVQWDFGDGNTSTSFTPTHYYGTVGTYTICLQGVNGSVVDTSCQQIVVEDCCVNQAVQFTEISSCCFQLEVDNDVDQFFTGVKIRLDNPGQMQSGINFDPLLWGLINAPTATCLELGYVGAPHIPLGPSLASSTATFCLDAPTTAPLAVHVDWLVGPDSICTTTDSLECLACIPDGANFSTFIQAKTHTPSVTYNEIGRSVVVDPLTEDIFVGANTSFLGEIGNNGNAMMARLDTCGQQVILPKINGEPDPTLIFNVENERLVDMRNSGITIFPGGAFIEVLTVRNSPTDRGVVINIIDDDGCQISVIDYTATAPFIDEVVNYAFLEGQWLYVIGTWPGSDRHAFVMGLDFSSANPSFYQSYTFANNTPHMTTGESAMIYNNELYLTGAEGNLMYIAKLNPMNGNLISPTSVNTIDIDGNPATPEVGKTIKHILGEINVMGNITTSTQFPPSVSHRPFLVKTGPNIGACSDVVDVAIIYNFSGGDEQVEDMVIRDDNVIFGGRARYDALGLMPFPNYDTLSQRAYIAELDVNGGFIWGKTYEHSNSLSDLALHGDGYTAVGHTYTPNIPIVGGGTTPEHYDIWAVKTDATGQIADCDCFESLTSSLALPAFVLDCVPGSAIPENISGNFHTFECAPLDSIQTYCGPPCGTGFGGGIPCSSGCCAYISGVKFEDSNCDGVRDPFEPGICGWQIQLTDGVNTYTTTTNAAGFYAFSNLCPGDYVVSEVQQICWSQSFPTGSGTHAIGLGSNTYALNLDFGNCIEINCGLDLGSQLVSTDPDSCKWNLQYDQFLCNTLQLNRIELISNTPGVDLTDLVLKSGFQLDPFRPASPQKVSIYNGQNTSMPGGAATDLICFRLDNICDSTQFPQELIVKYFIDLPCSLEREYCTDTLYANCGISCPADCTIDSLNISTGYNPMTNSLIPTGGGDVLWQMVATPPSAGWTVPRNSFVVPANGGWDWNNNATSSRWISGQPNSTFGTSNNPPCTSQAYEFERCFCLEEADSIRFNFGMMADDYARILLRDDPQTTVDTLYSHDCSTWPLGSHSQNFGNPDTVNVVRYLPAGKHCVKAQLWNTDGVAMGFNLQGYIYGDHIVADTCCMVKSAIAGTKFMDGNCNGQRDVIQGNLEIGMCDWPIVLCDTFDNPLDTMLTDNRGVYSFNCIEPGCYRVKEIQRKGWSQTLPTTPYYQVCVDTFEVATGLDFGNCNSVCDSLLAYEGTPTPATCCKWITLENQQIGFDVTRVNFKSMSSGQNFDFSGITTSSSFISAPLGSASFDVIYQPTGPSPIPTGAYPDAVYVCLDQSGIPAPQLVTVDYHVDGAGYCGDKICTDSIWFNCPPPSPCDSVSISYVPTQDTTDYCCYDLMVYNPYPDYFTEIDITTVGTVDMVNRVILNPGQWFTTMNTTQHVELLSTTGNLCPPANLKRYLPTGNLMPVKFCLDNYPTSNQQLYVKLDACNGDSCTQVLDFECNTSCVEIVSDSIWCDSSGYKYAFEFTNTWDKDIHKATVINLNPATANVIPDTLHFSPPIPVNGTYMDTFCFSNIVALDSLKFQIQFFEQECCWCVSDPLCMEVPECPCSPCDSLEYVLTPSSINGDSCCFTLDLYNYCADSIKSIRTRTLNGTQFLTQSATFPWAYDNYLPPTEADWYPLPYPPGTNPIPLGWTTNKIEFCLGGLNSIPSNSDILEVSLVDFNDNEICKDTLEACAIPDTCLVILPDTFICLDNGCRELHWSIRNESSFDAQKILINSAYTMPTIGTITPTVPFTYVGNIPIGATVPMPPITICGVDSTDVFCIQASIYDTLTLDNNCCHSDTVCVPIPPCPVIECDPCDSLEYVLTPSSINGDSCCFTLDLYNYCADSIKSIRTRTLNGTQFLTQSATFPWSFDNYLPPTEADWYPLPYPPGTNPIPLGWTTNKIEFCLAGLNSNPSNPDILEVSLVDFNDNEICKDTLEACAIVDTCLVILPDTFICLPNGCRELHWSVRNESSFDAQKILINSAFTMPTVGSISPTVPFSYVGNIPMGATVSMPPITICGVDSTDVFCIQAAIYDTIQPNNNCCQSDTVCASIPSCPDVFDCDSLDWTGFDIILDTTNCQPGMYPDVDVIPVFGITVPDWIEYDLGCNLSIEQTDFGPTYPSFLSISGGNPNFLVCVTAYKIIGADTCEFEVIRDLTLDPCPPANFTCDSLGWTGIDIILDTTNCQPGMYPDVDVIPVFGVTVPDWIEYDLGCNLSIEQTDFGPTYPSFLSISAGNPNFLVCVTAYKIVGNDTCSIELIRDLSLDVCPVASCCQDSTTFYNAVQNGFTYTVSGQNLTIDNPLLDSCDVATIDWNDTTTDVVAGNNFPITHTYIFTPIPSTYGVCIEVVQTDLDGTLCWQDDVCELIVIGTATPNCCQDTVGFYNAVDNGFVITSSGLSVTIDNSLLDSCDNMTVDWGDGQTDFILASDLAFTHNYAADSAYVICIDVRRELNGVLCLERQYCDSLFITPSHEVTLLEDLKIYPNPTDRHLIVDFGQTTVYEQITVFDAVGRAVMIINGGDPVLRQNLDVNVLPAGVYLIKIGLDGYSTTKRFIKQ